MNVPLIKEKLLVKAAPIWSSNLWRNVNPLKNTGNDEPTLNDTSVTRNATAREPQGTAAEMGGLNPNGIKFAAEDASPSRIARPACLSEPRAAAEKAPQPKP